MKLAAKILSIMCITGLSLSCAVAEDRRSAPQEPSGSSYRAEHEADYRSPLSEGEFDRTYETEPYERGRLGDEPIVEDGLSADEVERRETEEQLQPEDGYDPYLEEYEEIE